MILFYNRQLWNSMALFELFYIVFMVTLILHYFEAMGYHFIYFLQSYIQSTDIVVDMEGIVLNKTDTVTLHSGLEFY